MYEYNIKVKVRRQGQPAPYKDSYYEYDVDFGERDCKKSENQVISFARYLRGGDNLITDKHQRRENETTYFKPHLHIVKNIEKNLWNILIIEAYTG